MSMIINFTVYSSIGHKKRTYIEKERGGVSVDTDTGVYLIVGILVVVLLIGSLKSQAEWIVNFLLRGVLGMMSIYFVNLLLADVMPGMRLGYNPITFVTTGILGMPGIAMLYGNRQENWRHPRKGCH